MSGLSDFDVQFTGRQYGKNYVRLLYVKREGPWHVMKEIEVSTALTLSDTRDFTRGDNSQIIATDSQKNTVYILAKKYGVETIEKFAMQLSGHFLGQYNHVTDARIYIEERPWRRIKQGGKEHAHAFVSSGECTRFCSVHQSKHGQPKVTSGIKDLKVLKTTQSAFVNFVKDEYRSLPDMDDRIFCTIVTCKWNYANNTVDFDAAWETVKNCILDEFAGPPEKGKFSPSVQKTLYDTQKLALSKIPQMEDISIELPNVHAYEFDFKRFPAFGFSKNGEVFQPTDKPSGNIQATVKRRFPSKL